MNEKQFISLMCKAGFGEPYDEFDFERLAVVVATGLITGARVHLEQGDLKTAFEFERRAQRIEDKLRELGAFDFLNN